MIQPGQVFNNRYKIISALGKGGFGAVYKVWDDNLQRFCAIKENLQVSAESQKQFKREAIMLANLNHPHLVRVTDYFIIPEQGQYLVMDYVDGDDLHTILAKSEAPLPVDQSLEWIKQVCDALIYIHGQNPPIIHRDVKPANIRITPQGKAVLVDFGLAKTFDDGMKTSMGARGYTPYFASPEQYGIGGTDIQSDIYSLGVTLYYLLTLRTPPESIHILVGKAKPAPPVKAIYPDVPDAVSSAIQYAIEVFPPDRCKSVNDFKNALEGKGKAPMQVIATPVKTDLNKLILSNSMEFVLIPKGEFVMGCDHYDDERPKHKVNISYDYWMAKFPVTTIQYNQFVKRNFPANKEECPVTGVSWFHAQEYIKWLNEQYKSDIPKGYAFRLPSEAEWEKTARGNTGNVYPWGDFFDKNRCNTTFGNNESATPVGLFSPQGDSPFGASDMAGNIWEWTRSLGGHEGVLYGTGNYQYPYDSHDGRENESASDKVSRVLRGGSFMNDDWNARSSTRIALFPNGAKQNIGFRVAISPVVEDEKPNEESGNFTATNLANKKFIFSNGMEFMRVSAGKFLMGSDKNDNEKPLHEVEISYDYWTARYPITNEQYGIYAKVKEIEHPVKGWENKKNHPVVNIKWADAVGYCQWLNDTLKAKLPSGMLVRLPTEAEWEKSARGTDGREYPWGITFAKNKCNSQEGRKGNTTPVDLYLSEGNSPYGCADMAGNIWEWTHSVNKNYPYNAEDGREDEQARDIHVMRGGSYDDESKFLRCAYRYWDIPSYWFNHVGFRVVVSVPLLESELLKSEEHYHKAIKDSPNNAVAHKKLGVFLQSHNRIHEAESAYRKAIELDPNYATAYNNLGVLLKTQNRLVEAEEAYRKAIEINPEYASACFNLGLLLSYQNRIEESSKWFKKAIVIDPSLEQRLNK